MWYRIYPEKDESCAKNTNERVRLDVDVRTDCRSPNRWPVFFILPIQELVLTTNVVLENDGL